MTYLEWNKDYDVGIKAMNNHHKKLFTIINKLYSGISSDTAKNILQKTLIELIDYTKYHFKAEENLMATHNYPELSYHKMEHKKLIMQIDELQQQFDEEKGQLIIIIKIQNILSDWLLHHIMETDKKYGQFLNDKGIV